MIPLRNKYMMMERELDEAFELGNLSDCLIKIVRTECCDALTAFSSLIFSATLLQEACRVFFFLSGADTGTFTLQLLNASVD